MWLKSRLGCGKDTRFTDHFPSPSHNGNHGSSTPFASSLLHFLLLFPSPLPHKSFVKKILRLSPIPRRLWRDTLSLTCSLRIIWPKSIGGAPGCSLARPRGILTLRCSWNSRWSPVIRLPCACACHACAPFASCGRSGTPTDSNQTVERPYSAKIRPAAACASPAFRSQGIQQPEICQLRVT